MGQVLAFDPSKPFTVVPPSNAPRTGLATVGEQMAAKGQAPLAGMATPRGPSAAKGPLANWADKLGTSISVDQLSEFVDQPSEGVTLGEIMENPAEGFARMGAILKRDLTDPKTWMAAAAMYFGPKVLPKVGPAVRSAMNATVKGAVKGTAAVGDFVSPDIVGVFSPRGGRAIEVAQRMRAALPETPAASAPVEPAAQAPRATPLPSTQAASQLARMKGALTDEEALAVDGLVKQGYPREDVLAAIEQQRATGAASTGAVAQSRPKLSAAEAKTYVQLRKAGKTDAEIYETLAVLRQMTGGKLPTDAQVKSSVAHRNSTGRW